MTPRQTIRQRHYLQGGVIRLHRDIPPTVPPPVGAEMLPRLRWWLFGVGMMLGWYGVSWWLS